jgi:hypothetical protein
MFISFELSSYLSFIVKKKSNLGHVLSLTCTKKKRICNSFFSFYLQSNYGNNAQDQKSPPSRIKNSYSTSVGSPASSASAAAATSTEIEDTRLKSLIREIRESVGNAKRFWIKLPYSMCEEEAKGSTAEVGFTIAAIKKNTIPSVSRILTILILLI